MKLQAQLFSLVLFLIILVLPIAPYLLHLHFLVQSVLINNQGFNNCEWETIFLKNKSRKVVL